MRIGRLARRVGATLTALAIGAAGLVAIAADPAAAANAGDLDVSWGGDGQATGLIGAYAGGPDVIEAPDGKIVTGGLFTSTPTFLVARFNPDGTPDGTFEDATGTVLQNFGTTVHEVHVAVQADRKVVFAGQVTAPGGLSRILVARLDENGLVDTSFAAGGPTPGHVLLDLGDASQNFNLGGSIALQPDGFGGERILVGASVRNAVPGYQLMGVARLNGDGTLDTTFGGGDGHAEADFGIRSIVQDLVVTPAGDILLSGHTGTAGGGDDAGIAAFTANGVLYTAGNGPIGGGTRVVDQAPGRDDHAATIAVDPADDDIAIAGGVFAPGPTETAVSVLNAGGALSPSFGSGGVFRSSTLQGAGGVMFDASGRVVLGTTTTAGRGAVVRLTGPGTDASFAGDGIADALCGSGGIQAVTFDSAGRIVAAGTCGTNILDTYRLFAETDAPSSIDVTAVGVTPNPAPARRLELPIDAVDRGALAGHASSLQSSPLRNTPLRNTPLRNTPLRNTPLRNTPLRNTPLRNTTIPILLSDIPLELPGGWDAVLETTPFAGMPPTTVTIQQLLALDPAPASVEQLTLYDIDLSSTPLRNTSITATLLGLTPVGSLPVPGDDWCAFLANQPLNCTNGVAPTVTTLTDLEIAGDDLAAFYASPLPADVLSSLPPTTPLLGIRLADLSLGDLPGQFYVSTDALDDQTEGLFFTCTPACGFQTLASAQFQGLLQPSATVADLLATRTIHGQAFSLSDLIIAMIPADEFPWEQIPLDELEALAPIAAGGVEYSVDLSVLCGAGEYLEVRVQLPDGARVIDDSAQFFESGEPLVGPLESFAGTTELLAGHWGICNGSSRSLQLLFGAEGPTGIGSADVSVTGRVVESVGDFEFGENEIASDVMSGADLVTEDPTEPDDVTATPIARDVLYTGYVESAADVDYFTLPAPAAGTTVQAYLSHLPADYDLVLYGPEPGQVETSPLRNTPLRNTPLRNTPVEDDGIDPTGNVLVPETLQDVPLRNTPLRNTSINRSLHDEFVSTVVAEGETTAPLTIQVSGYDGATSAEPYMLRVRYIAPAADLPCIARNYTGTGTPGSFDANAVPANTETLILVNEGRLGQIYATDPAGVGAVSGLLTKVEALASRSDVNGVVVPVEANAAVAAAYAEWDADPCSVAAANEVVAKINAFVDSIRVGITGLKHVVIVGSDEVIPQARLRDQVTLSNQTDYRYDAALGGLDNPISRAFARGYFLSDEPYGDFDPAPFVADALYLADVGLGRLVETPSEMSLAIDRFVAADGRLDLATSYTSGYDFLKDGAARVDAALRTNAQTSTGTPSTAVIPPSDINDTWTAADAIAAWNSGARAISVNAHYDHYRALPAADDTTTQDRDLLFSSQLLASQLSPDSLLFTMGCEAGLNIADVLVPLGPGGAPLPETQDWAQTVAQKGGLLAGNTGYGYGDTDIVAYSEQVYARFAEHLDGAATVGQALALAKQAFVSDLGIPGVYDAKALQEAVLFGLPMFRVGSGGIAAPSFMPEEPAASTAAVTTSTPFAADFAPERVGATDAPSYWRLPGEPLVVTHHRPVQFAHTVEVASGAGQRAHGVLITELASTDVDGVEPLIVRPTIDLALHEPKPEIEEVVFPTTLSNLTRTASPAGGKVDKLVLLPGQFFTDSDPSDGGVQRLFSRMGGEVLHSSDDTDFMPPTIRVVDAVTIGGAGGLASFSVTTSPDAVRAFALYREEGDPNWKPLELSGSAGVWTATVPLAAGSDEIVEWFVQVVDEAQNVGISTNKGRYFNGLPVPPAAASLSITPPAGPDGFHPDGTEVALAGDLAGRTALVSIDGGPFEPTDGSEAVHGDGVHRVVFRVDGQDLSATVAIDATAPTIDATYPSNGAELTTASSTTPVFSCADTGSGVASCEASPATLDLTPGTHTITFSATDRVGQTASVIRSYSVAADTMTFTGFFAPVNNAPTFNKTKAGSAVPVKFRLSEADGTIVSDTAAVETIASWRVSCDAAAPMDTIEELVSVSASSGLFYDPVAQRFQYNWKTQKSWAGTCRQLVLSFSDGTKASALFDFTK